MNKRIKSHTIKGVRIIENKNEEGNSLSTVKTEIKSKKNISNDNKKFIQIIYGEGFKKILMNEKWMSQGLLPCS